MIPVYLMGIEPSWSLSGFEMANSGPESEECSDLTTGGLEALRQGKEDPDAGFLSQLIVSHTSRILTRIR